MGEIKRQVKFTWKSREYVAVGSGLARDIVMRSIERRLDNNHTGVALTLWDGPEEGHYTARYFDGVRYHEDDVFLIS